MVVLCAPGPQWCGVFRAARGRNVQLSHIDVRPRPRPCLLPAATPCGRHPWRPGDSRRPPAQGLRCLSTATGFHPPSRLRPSGSPRPPAQNHGQQARRCRSRHSHLGICSCSHTHFTPSTILHASPHADPTYSITLIHTNKNSVQLCWVCCGPRSYVCGFLVQARFGHWLVDRRLFCRRGPRQKPFQRAWGGWVMDGAAAMQWFIGHYKWRTP